MPKNKFEIQGYVKILVLMFIYLLTSTLSSGIFCNNITEGYICTIMIAMLSFYTFITSLGILLIANFVINKRKLINTLTWCIPLLAFEIICLILNNEPLLFGLSGSNFDSYEGTGFAMSMSSLVGVVVIYGILFYIKNKPSKNI